MGGRIGRFARRHPWPLLIVGLLTTLLGAAALIAHPTAATAASAAQAVASGAAVLVTAWWCMPAGRTRSMVLLLTAAALWWVGDLAWLIATLVDGRWTDPSRVVYLLAGLSLMASQLPARNVFREATTRAVLDGLLIGLVVAFVVWSTVPAFPGDPFGYLTIVNCLSNGLLVSFTLLNLTQGPATEKLYHWALFGAALLITAQHGVHTVVEATSGWSGGVLDLGWIAASVLRTIAAAAALERMGRTATPLTEPHPPGFWERVVPLVAMAVGVSSALLVTTYTTGTVVVGSLLVACLVARQIAADQEQRSLRGRLSSAAVELRRRADRDVLTGLHNRSPLLGSIEAALDRPDDGGGEVGLLFLDVDHFKHINDRFGHSVGDLVLIGISRALAAAAGPGDLVARLGGDEFIVLRPRVTHDPTFWAETVRAQLEVPILVAGGHIRVTVSVGVVTARPGAMSADTLLARGDVALYRAKRAGRNRSAGSDPLQETAPDLGRITQVLGALERRELGPYYQPIVTLEDRRVIGMEALCRWTHQDGTVSDAPEFLPDLLAAGRGSEITELMLLAVCTDFAHGVPAERGWTASINLSAEELSNPSVIDQFARVLAVTGMPAHRLHVEIDERTEPTGAVARVLNGLDRLGVRLVLDDFGAGWSTFGQLVRLAPVAVKLDRSLIDPDGVSDDSQPLAGSGRLATQLLVESFVRVAHHLGMAVVAEGVELEEQRAALLDVGCEYGQGYLWCRPLPLPVVLDWVAEQDRARLSRSRS